MTLLCGCCSAKYAASVTCVRLANVKCWGKTAVSAAVLDLHVYFKASLFKKTLQCRKALQLFTINAIVLNKYALVWR